ncbi:unnamed protein product [Allacma fusca]|uniref:Transmembrane protein n=1 Tax=Allacma fusca TaxID=39272 RepID=A0A8J2JFB6_9HEXA|nr:unnamed protein product [Allacma fusca]
MGEEGDDSSVTEEQVEKKYCCGNCPQREAINISRLDLGGAIYLIIFFLIFSVVYILIPDYFRNYVELEKALAEKAAKEAEAANKEVKGDKQRILAAFMELSDTHKMVVILLELVCGVLSLLLAILLLIASKAKNVANLKRWFTLSIVKSLPALALDIYTVITFFEDRMFSGSVVLLYYLYRLYSLWICLELQKEIKTIDTDFIHPMYRDNP